MQQPENEKFDVIEVEVNEDGTLHKEDIHRNLNEDIRTAEEPTTRTRTRTRERERLRDRVIPEKKNKFGWAFFLAFMFSGMGISIATDTMPLGFFLGMAIGFLFFVDPIYQKVMEKIEKL
jgi:hypothetical protein